MPRSSADLNYLDLSGSDIRVDEASDTVTYIGEAEPGSTDSEAKWRIKRIVVSGTVTSITWALNNPDFVHVWNDRATYF
jgi:hypothetical protein